MALLSLGKYALIFSILFCTGATPTFDATPTLKQRTEQVQLQFPFELKNRVEWKVCGDWNGTYYWDGHIELCYENLFEGLEVSREILMHELGHAYTYGNHTDFSRWDGNAEDAADEFAAVFSIVQGRGEDLLVKARLWDKSGMECLAGDSHSCDYVRAKRYRTMYHGHVFPGSPEGKIWREALAYWKREMLRNGINAPVDYGST